MRLITFIAGSGLVTAGAWMAWPPAAFIVSGVALVVLACYGQANDIPQRTE